MEIVIGVLVVLVVALGVGLVVRGRNAGTAVDPEYDRRLAEQVALRLAQQQQTPSEAERRRAPRKRRALEGSGGVPDFTFLLPQNLCLHMDVKFPLDNYLRYLDAGSEVERERCRRDFLRDVRARVKELTTRNYVDPASGTVDCMLL